MIQRNTAPLTDQGQQLVLCALDQLLVDLDHQVSEHLLVARQLKVGQAVLILPGRVVLGEVLQEGRGQQTQWGPVRQV